MFEHAKLSCQVFRFFIPPQALSCSGQRVCSQASTFRHPLICCLQIGCKGSANVYYGKIKMKKQTDIMLFVVIMSV